MRHAGGDPGLSSRSRPVLGLLLLLALGSACKRESGPDLRPDQLLRDSLGLSDDDRVHRVRLAGAGNRETVEPDSVLVRPGDWVEFATADRRVHAITFVLDSLPAGGADFMRTMAQEASPPLVEQQARFVVSFEGAPVGRYPFVVAGNGQEARGAVFVAEPPR